MIRVSCSIWFVKAALCCSWLAACGGTEQSSRIEPVDDRNSAGGDAGAKGLLTCETFRDRYEVLPVDAFEGVSVQDNAMSPAGWWESNDGSNPNHAPLTAYFDENGREVPANFRTSEGGAPSLTDEENPCEASERSMRLVSELPGFQEWGMSFGSNFNPMPVGTSLRDATDWEGVAFYARRAADSNASTFYLTLADDYTSAQGSGEYCRDGLFVADLCDPFGRAVGVTREWRIYQLPFDQLYQRGFGAASPLEGPDTEELLGMKFEMGAGTWEFWVDEIVYYREKR